MGIIAISIGTFAQTHSDKNVAQSRAAEAKVKASTAKTKADADALIRMSKEDSWELITAIDQKMIQARQTLMNKLATKEITQAQFDEKLKQLMLFEVRKSAIVKGIE